MGPAPVGIQSDGSGLGGAAGSASTSALLPAHLGVGFGGLLASQLSAGGSEERKGSESKCLGVHFDGWRTGCVVLVILEKLGVWMLLYIRCISRARYFGS